MLAILFEQNHFATVQFEASVVGEAAHLDVQRFRWFHVTGQIDAVIAAILTDGQHIRRQIFRISIEKLHLGLT